MSLILLRFKFQTLFDPNPVTAPASLHTTLPILSIRKFLYQRRGQIEKGLILRIFQQFTRNKTFTRKRKKQEKVRTELDKQPLKSSN